MLWNPLVVYLLQNEANIISGRFYFGDNLDIYTSKVYRYKNGSRVDHNFRHIDNVIPEILAYIPYFCKGACE